MLERRIPENQKRLRPEIVGTVSEISDLARLQNISKARKFRFYAANKRRIEAINPRLPVVTWFFRPHYERVIEQWLRFGGDFFLYLAELASWL